MYPVLLNGAPRRIDETDLNRKWNIKNRNIDSLLIQNQIDILKKLIHNNQWIIEGSNNPIDMMKT
jgi:hypothetical protein